MQRAKSIAALSGLLTNAAATVVVVASTVVTLFAQDNVAQKTCTCQLTIELVDATTGASVPGVIRIRDQRDQIVAPPELMQRGIGVSTNYTIHQWSLLPKAVAVTVPQSQLIVEGFQGLETEVGRANLDLRGRSEARVAIPLTRFVSARQLGMQSGNTHIHLRRLARKESEQYLLQVAAAEQLDLLYISYLERAEADLEYTTNNYTPADLRRLTSESHASHAHQHEFDNGQEHRHNFSGFGEGYGHVMFLHLAELVHPVSIGPGIMLQGFDQPALNPGILNAIDQEAAVIWCHNRYGLEDIPNWLAGNLHANNIFDGGTHGSYQHSFYRYLNAGLKVPFSTGTDWFVYDFNRVYIHGTEAQISADNRLSSTQWLDALRSGRSSITNGPLLELRVEGSGPGAELNVKSGQQLAVEGRAISRVDFTQLELVRNGQVIETVASERSASGGHFKAELAIDLTADEPCWLAVRTPPPSTPREPESPPPTPLNEYGRELYSHTSAIHIDVDDRRFADPAAIEGLIAEMQESMHTIETSGKFKTPEDKAKILSLYTTGIEKLRDTANRRR